MLSMGHFIHGSFYMIVHNLGSCCNKSYLQILTEICVSGSAAKASSAQC